MFRWHIGSIPASTPTFPPAIPSLPSSVACCLMLSAELSDFLGYDMISDWQRIMLGRPQCKLEVTGDSQSPLSNDLWWPLLYCFTVLFNFQLFNVTLLPISVASSDRELTGEWREKWRWWRWSLAGEVGGGSRRGTGGGEWRGTVAGGLAGEN